MGTNNSNADLTNSAKNGGRANYNEPNYDPNKIGPYALENPLTFIDGREVASPAEWQARRREILGIFAHEMFGEEPPAPETVITELTEEGNTLGGFGVRRQYRMWFKTDKSGPSIDWLVILPKHAKGPVPVILFLNYAGNHELIPDTEVPVPDVWLRTSSSPSHRPFPERRGAAANPNREDFVLPAGEIISRGYAIISACYAQVSPDPDGYGCDAEDPRHRQDPFAYTGIFDLWPKRDPNRDDNTTAIGAWAWALSRGLDLAERIPEIDAARSVATGYSRLGKTALLAAARDERFAVCVPNQTGGGGCPLAKRDYGENIATEMRSFTHWYCSAYKKFERWPAELLTFDQHLLLASIAPRALLVEGYDEPWFDTEGEYLACRAAAPVWEFLGKGTMPDHPYPADYDTSCIGQSLGYVRRDLWHGLSYYDWTWLLDFADKNLQAGR